MRLLTPLFVYGTLRPGFRLWHLIAPAVYADEPGITYGMLYHRLGGSDESPIYPLANFYSPGVIKGTVLWVDPKSDHYINVSEMEKSSGYEELEINVTLENAEETKAIGYQYWGYKGPQIEDGEWKWGYEAVSAG